LVGVLPWGSHLCLFYETKTDLVSAVVPFLKAGLESQECCIWAVSELLTLEEAKQALRQAIPDFDRYVADGSIEIFPASEWYLDEGRLDLTSIIGRWHEKLQDALSRGYEGLRASGDTVWLKTEHLDDFSAYERELDEALAGRCITVLCTYPLTVSRAADVLDLARIHQFTMALRKGNWEVIEASEPEIGGPFKRSSEARHAESHRSAKLETLTARERAILEKIVAGASSKEAARRLGISPRTVDFHRANILQKLGAKNTADLLRIALTG
jgi:DNA-binding CsgD family transcriptional regulator